MVPPRIEKWAELQKSDRVSLTILPKIDKTGPKFGPVSCPLSPV
jgi:hypothetical protein